MNDLTTGSLARHLFATAGFMPIVALGFAVAPRLAFEAPPPR
jgi:hypothetical protein